MWWYRQIVTKSLPTPATPKYFTFIHVEDFTFRCITCSSSKNSPENVKNAATTSHEIYFNFIHSISHPFLRAIFSRCTRLTTVKRKMTREKHRISIEFDWWTGGSATTFLRYYLMFHHLFHLHLTFAPPTSGSSSISQLVACFAQCHSMFSEWIEVFIEQSLLAQKLFLFRLRLQRAEEEKSGEKNGSGKCNVNCLTMWCCDRNRVVCANAHHTILIESAVQLHYLNPLMVRRSASLYW